MAILYNTPAESVRVFVDFNPHEKTTIVRPVAFLWNGKRYEVSKVNLVYRKYVGTRYVWCFAVSDEANTYGLTYDPEKLTWTINEVQMEG